MDKAKIDLLNKLSDELDDIYYSVQDIKAGEEDALDEMQLETALKSIAIAEEMIDAIVERGRKNHADRTE